ncbi:MAG: VPLPA-CTERM sorting domain-containing protein [Gammaproteobacteria bacterium]|nr:VPLPA-CTERM sorting domain-containing protein [Gammaproteobacteria bacterium]
MATKTISSLAAVIMLAASATANANVISFADPGQQVGVGQQVSFDITMNFFESTVGGSFDVFYDASLLSFVSFEFNADFIDTAADPDFAVAPDNCFFDGAAIAGCSVGDAELNGIGFGSIDGIVGMHTIGTVTFETLGIGVGLLSMATNDAPWEGFYSAIDAGEMTVVYGPGKVHVVPLPAGVWLLFSALGITGLLRRRRSS